MTTKKIDDDEKKLIDAIRIDSELDLVYDQNEILRKQNIIMKDMLRYLGFNNVEQMFWDCPMPSDVDLTTPLGYNAPTKRDYKYHRVNEWKPGWIDLSTGKPDRKNYA